MPVRNSSINPLTNLVMNPAGDDIYAVIKEVSEHLAAIDAVAQEDLQALTNAWNEAKDFSGLVVVGGENAGWDPATNTLTVPTVKGDTGDKGEKGDKGDAGPQGNRGSQGERGYRGEKGDKGDTGAVGPKGDKGDRGEKGEQGAKGDTGDVGPKGDKGDKGDKGAQGEDLKVESIIYLGEGAFRWTFNDGTEYTTPDLRGSKGDKGDTGTSVHHLQGVYTTDPHGNFGVFGELDTYSFYGDADETVVLGSFTVRNGIRPEDAYNEGFMIRSYYDVDGDGVVDDSNALGGKDLATIELERDIAIQAALTDLGTNYTVANNAEKDLLTDLSLSDKVFVADDGDGKWAQYWVTGVTDGLGSTSTFEVVMDEDTYLNANTREQIKATYESNPDTNAYTDVDKAKIDNISVTQPVDLDVVESETVLNTAHRTSDGSDHTFIDQDVTTTATPTFAGVVTSGLVDGRDVSVDGAKLDTIESGATADQTDVEIAALYEGLANTNKYTDAEKALVDVVTVLDTTATTLPQAINELHNELDLHIADTEDAHDASAISYVPGSNTYAVGTNVQTTVEQIDTELENQDGRLDTLEADVGTAGSVLNTVKTTAVNATYDNTTSGLVGTTIQTAIDELDTAVDNHIADNTNPHEVNKSQIGLGNVDNTADVDKPISTLTQTALDDKVDKVVGKQLSTEDYTTAEKTLVDIATVLSTTADTLPKAVNELNTRLTSAEAVTGTTTETRYDKVLSNLDVVEMQYTNGDLTAVRYTGDDDVSVYYRDVLEYTNGNLTSVKHYYNTADLVTESATTALTYDVDDNLVSTSYTE